MNSERAFKFTIGLLYPAILGSIIYNIFSELSVQRITANPVMHILWFLILVQYVMDYLYTNTDRIRKEYSFSQGICDFFIVVLLFTSINAVYEVPKFKPLAPHIAALLAGTKLLALIWELLRRKKESQAIGSFGVFFLAYCLVYFLASDSQYVLLTVLFLDVLTFLKYGSIRPLFQRDRKHDSRESLEG